MNTLEYQEKAKRTLNFDLSDKELLSNMVFGIFGESAEVSEIIKKHLYQGHDLDTSKIADELGDVMWYIANLCNLLDIKLDEVMDNNIKKLEKRYPDGFSVDKSVNRQ